MAWVVIERMGMKHCGWRDAVTGKPTYSTEICSRATVLTTNPTWDWSGLI